MLKKFFISLLILAAIGAEGAAYLPENIYDLYMRSGSEIDLLSKCAMRMNQLNKTNSKCSEVSGISANTKFSLSSNFFEQLNDKNFDNASYSGSNCFSIYSLAETAFEFSFKPDKGIVMYQSDTSPPYFNI